MTESVMNEIGKDESDSRKYFVMTPHLVWAMCRGPYDLALWYMIKMIAWENGTCYIGDRNLARLTGMSRAKVVECRKYLLKVGLLDGYLQKRGNTKRPVWHLTIPDIWEENIRWSKNHTKLHEKRRWHEEFLDGQKDTTRPFKRSPG